MSLPWNASYVFQPLDYSSLAKEVCACLEPALQEGKGRQVVAPEAGRAPGAPAAAVALLLLPPRCSCKH